MAKILIPNNTTNCISKVGEHQTEYRKSQLFLGSLEATNHLLLRQYRIIAILTVGCGLEVVPPQGVAHKIINIEDNVFQNIAQHFSDCNDFIKKHLERGNVLVHCKAGISRSASVVLAYTIKTRKIRLSKAIEKVREARSMINPNQGFMAQLKEYERKIRKALEQKGMKLN